MKARGATSIVPRIQEPLQGVGVHHLVQAFVHAASSTVDLLVQSARQEPSAPRLHAVR